MTTHAARTSSTTALGKADSGAAGAAVAAELGLLALAGGTAASFISLFDSWSFLSELAVPIVTAWLLAVVLRRLRVGLAGSLCAQVLSAIFLLTTVFAHGSNRFALPTPAAARLINTEISTSFSEFSRLVAPVPATQGFLFVIALGFWLFVCFSDAAAFRYDGPAQAAVPFLATFLALGLLARQSNRLASTICFLAGLLIYTVTQIALRTSRTQCDGRPQRYATRSVARSALLIGVVAMLGGVAAAALLPQETDPIINLGKLGRGSEPRTVVSPFVGIRSLLGSRSDAELFTVRSDKPAYWRLTALEEFDPNRDIWISRGTYQRISGQLPSNLGPTVSGPTLRQEIQISGLSGLWLPGAYEPSEISSDTEVSYDRESSSIILVSTDSNIRPIYRLESLIPDFSAAAQAQAGTTENVDPIYFVKSQSPALTPELLQGIIAEAKTPFQQVIALQNWFRSEFRYDETVDFSQSDDPLANFLQARAGFCQQFSSAFALLARELGFASRVAVGFTPGDPISTVGKPQLNGASRTEYLVRGGNAHAWPEIYFQGLGWVPFEPTPGRGDPQTAPYTGVAAAQAAPPASQSSSSTTLLPSQNGGVGTTQAPNPSGNSSSSATNNNSNSKPTNNSAASPKSRPEQVGEFLKPAAAVALVVAGLCAVALLLVRRSRVRKRRRSLTRLRTAAGKERELIEAEVVEDAWNRSLLWLALIELQPEDWETPTEFVERAARKLSALETAADTASQPSLALQGLAQMETARRYGRLGEGSVIGLAAQQAADSVEQLIRYSSSGRRSRSFALVLASLK
ncbi:MAG: DUF3488 and transglutaminase-like domain-containing protein [Actinomycetes bacterium]